MSPRCTNLRCKNEGVNRDITTRFTTNAFLFCQRLFGKVGKGILFKPEGDGLRLVYRNFCAFHHERHGRLRSVHKYCRLRYMSRGKARFFGNFVS